MFKQNKIKMTEFLKKLIDLFSYVVVQMRNGQRRVVFVNAAKVDRSINVFIWYK